MLFKILTSMAADTWKEKLSHASRLAFGKKKAKKGGRGRLAIDSFGRPETSVKPLFPMLQLKAPGCWIHTRPQWSAEETSTSSWRCSINRGAMEYNSLILIFFCSSLIMILRSWGCGSVRGRWRWQDYWFWFRKEILHRRNS